MKIKRLVFAQRAIEDLTRIWFVRSEYGEKSANDLIRNIQASAEKLRHFPYLGSERSNIRKDLRCLSLKKFLLLYKIEEDHILVVAVIESARDWKKLV